MSNVVVGICVEVMSLNYGFEYNSYVKRHQDPRKLTVLIEGPSKVVSFDDKVVVTHGKTHVVVNTAIVLWDYHNVTSDNVIVVTKFIGLKPVSQSKIRIGEGYYDFDALVEALTSGLKKVGVLEIERLTTTDKCRIKIGIPGGGIDFVYFGTLAPLFGFAKSTRFIGAGWHVSPNKVDINRGLKYVEVSCDAVEVGIDGERNDVIATLPIPTKQSLKGSVQRHTDIETKVILKKGVHSSMVFRVKPNNGDAKIGAVLLELYIV